MVKSLRIGDYITENNLFLAPMAGYTGYPFRHLILPLSCGLCFTELVSAKGICYGSKGNAVLLKSDNDYNKTAVQIFGSEEYYLRKCCESEQLKPFNIVDINMGCPVPKVYKNGEGSALLKDVLKAEKLVKECVKSGKTITLKIRTGLVEGDDVATEFALMAENAGAKLITIHGRVRENYYSGEPDYNAIYKAKKSVNIPVIANGGIFTKQDAINMIDKTGADGVMIARGAIDNPFIFCEITGNTPTVTKKEFMLNHLNLMQQVYGERRATLEYRKFICCYLKGVQNSKDIKLKLMSSESVKEIIDIINQL